jgi:hypothetical protein
MPRGRDTGDHRGRKVPSERFRPEGNEPHADAVLYSLRGHTLESYEAPPLPLGKRGAKPVNPGKYNLPFDGQFDGYH